ncbi:MAG: tetrahydromethanopterin S-methyltransferase subunit A [Candidatus Thorarchaeota archaeon]
MNFQPAKDWPPASGDFEVGNPQSCVAICTLGKKFDIPTNYAIIGTCKTENIGIERVIINIISNSNIRFLILSGPEVPGHRTGESIAALHKFGIDTETRRIINAPGAIPYIENVSLEGIERFRSQVEFIDLMNKTDSEEIAAVVRELENKNPGPYSEPPIWIDFRGAPTKSRKARISADVSLLPEYGVVFDPSISLVLNVQKQAMVANHPSKVGIEIQSTESGSILVGKEF